MGQKKGAKWTRRGHSESMAAEHFGVSQTTIKRWKTKGWAVLFNDGSINVEMTGRSVEEARDPRGSKKLRLTQDPPVPSHTPSSTGPLDEDDLLTARTRKERALADKAELEVQQRRGDLVPIDEARKVYTSVVTAARVALEAVPARIAPQVLGLSSQVEIRRIVQAEIASALRSLPKEAPRVE